MRLMLGDCLQKLSEIADSSVDSIVTDPPYGLSFMGKAWDYDVPAQNIWEECLRVLKPGGHLLAFFGTRTYHRGVIKIEDAGFEIRDQIQWIYGSGFPKSLDVSKAIDKAAGAKREVISTRKTKDIRTNISQANIDNQPKLAPGSPTMYMEYSETAPATPEAIQWQGFGTALKPANEPIVVARKPLEKGLTVAENVLKWGTGALNIDGSRIEASTEEMNELNRPNKRPSDGASGFMVSTSREFTPAQGRWPANVLFDEEAASVLDEQSGMRTSGKPSGVKTSKGYDGGFGNGIPVTGFGDSGGASRFFFVVKDKEWQDQKDLTIAKHVAKNTNSEENQISIVLEAVRTNFKHDHKLLHSLDSIPDYKKCILLHNLALLAVKPENIGITEITQSLLKLFGSAHHAIEESISLESQKNNKGQTRFLYQAKASKSERGEGNVHPTVKPRKLMQYLINLVTPPNGVVLDPFMGSGTTGIAAKNLGFGFVGIEKMPEYFEIAKKRIESA